MKADPPKPETITAKDWWTVISWLAIIAGVVLLAIEFWRGD